MSRIPEEIEGLGKSSDRLRQNPQFDAGAYAFDRDSYFVWSRLDGHTSTRNVILMVGFEPERVIGILQSLRAAGGILRPGEEPAHVAAIMAAARARQAQAAREAAAKKAAADNEQAQDEQARRLTSSPSSSPAQGDRSSAARQDTALFLDQLTVEEATAMAAPADLSEEVKLRILTMRRKVAAADYFALFGVSRETGTRELKRAYFRLSKEFHPDRYYRKDTGPFGPWLGEIFGALAKAFETLSDDAARQRYMAALDGTGRMASGSQSRADYARELFERACNAETSGDLDGALKLFAAAIRVAPQARHASRAARCALAAGDLRIAEEYATKAASLEPNDPSVARVLADVYRAAGKLEEAEKTLVFALGLKSENDVLGKELGADLAAVRRERARAGPGPGPAEPG